MRSVNSLSDASCFALATKIVGRPLNMYETLQIVDLTPGAEWALHYLRAKDLPLVGSVSQTGFVEKYADRKVEYGELGHIAGSVKLNWFRVANTFVEGSARE